MKRILCMLIIVLACSALLSGACASETETIPGTADDFYDQQCVNAVPACDSSTFEIGFRVCKIPEELQTEDDSRVIQYDLILTNKTDETLNDLRFAAHFRDALQIVLTNPIWYNEPMNLGSANQDSIPSSVIYTWNPLVMLTELDVLRAMEPTDFYDILLEITWQGGSELIVLDAACASIPEQAIDTLTEAMPLDEEELAAMIEHGEQRSGSDQE